MGLKSFLKDYWWCVLGIIVLYICAGLFLVYSHKLSRDAYEAEKDAYFQQMYEVNYAVLADHEKNAQDKAGLDLDEITLQKRKELIKSLYNQGNSVQEISVILGFDENEIIKYLVD